MARRVEEIKRVRRDIVTDDTNERGMTENRDDMNVRDVDRYEEEYYDVGDNAEETGLNTASGVLALALLALALYLIWAALT